VAWVCDLPGIGSSIPIVVGNRIFLTTSTDDDEIHALGIDRKTGKTIWKKKVATGRKAMRGNTMSSPSGVSDGKRVYFLFGQGTLVAMSLDGEQLWKRELEKEIGMLSLKYGYSSSPLLHAGKLYIPLLYLPKGEQKAPNPGTTLLAVDTRTGKTIWAANRPSPATRESLDAYITPTLGKEGIVLTGGDLVTSHDPETGKEQWRYDVAEGDRKTNWRIIASPVAAGDLVVTPYPRGDELIALKPGGEKAWHHKGYFPDVCTPAYDQGLLYVLDGKKRYLTCIEAASGTELWQEKIDSDKGFFASPLVADGKIYTINLDGEVYIYAAGKETKLLERFIMAGENCSASIIAVDSDMFVRTPDKLVCVRRQQ
jgi:outer membrane protein assembly factor BamB